MHKLNTKHLHKDVPRNVEEELENAFKGLTFKVQNLSIIPQETTRKEI